MEKAARRGRESGFIFVTGDDIYSVHQSWQRSSIVKCGNSRADKHSHKGRNMLLICSIAFLILTSLPLSLWGYIKASYKQPCGFGPCLTWLFLQRCKTLCLPLASGRERGKGEGRLNETTKWRFERKIANFHFSSGLYSQVHFGTLSWNVLFYTIKIIWVKTNPRVTLPLLPRLPPVGLSSAEYQQQGKASCVSVNWTLGDAQLEVVNTATGRRRESGTPSRLCKHTLFTRWNRLYRKVRATVHAEGRVGGRIGLGERICEGEYIWVVAQLSGSWSASKTRIIWITGTNDPTEDN